ncbi:MAG TPA: TetR/AcrR family transcriptional regulator [Acidimicrobiia bacterium]|nr:TetR/AcrR family transcriptional regulator [Acidimicrobiia bacterium]
MPRIRAGSIEEHKVFTRLQILEAARTLLAETGNGDLNLGDLAAVAGIGRTTLYEYFRDRDDLIASLVEDALPGVIAELVSQMDQRKTPDALLLDLAELVVRFVATDPVLGVILHREVPKLGSNAQDRIRLAHTDLSAAMMGTYQSAVAAGRFRAIAPDLAGRLIQDTIMSAARAVISAPNRLAEVTSELRAFLSGGLAP